MRRQLSFSIALLLLICGRAAAQVPSAPAPPVAVTVCDLMSQPDKFNGRVVRVRAKISIAFEDFSLTEEKCPPAQQKLHAASVWLEYGGDESSPTVYCCGDHSRKPGEVIQEQGHVIPLRRDNQMLEFHKRLIAERRRRPDGQYCYGRECYLYDVTATITGHFFAMEQTKEGGISGYGHLGFNHILFIEEVTDVEARRTAAPAGGVFDCKSQPLSLSPAEVRELVSDYEKAKDNESWDRASQRALTIGAKYWGEPIDVSLWKLGGGSEGEAEHQWNSPDLLKILNFKFPYKNLSAGTSRSQFSATRTSCTTIVKPLPQSAKIGCEAPYWSVEDTESIAKRAQMDVDKGKVRWRLDYKQVAWNALREYAAKHSIVLSFKLKVLDCSIAEPSGPERDNFASCEWATDDELQHASVTTVRHAKLASSTRPFERVVWVPVSGGITTCKAE